MESYFLLLPIALPVLTGLFLLIMPEKYMQRGKEGALSKALTATAAAVLLLTALASFVCIFFMEGKTLTLFYLADGLPVYLKADRIGLMFAAVTGVVWLCTGFFAFVYMRKEKKEKRYFGFFFLVYGILTALDFSGNLLTFYLFYESLTLFSAPLVLHTGTREAVMAGLKYMFYSFCGAYMVLFGIYIVNRYGSSLEFTPGGVMQNAAGHEALLLAACFLMLLGFGVKAGMFPLHAWLPTAHPAAPAPASAALSGVIVKAGILGMVRTAYYIFSPEMIRGTWVQNTWLILSLLTIFMGSMLAYREKLLKKRLAYSTVSQLSYIIFGMALLNSTALTGALLHVVFHAFIKCALFLCAGAVIYTTGKTYADDLRGIGKQMPALMLCYTAVSLGLVGIPPFSGFISKWYLGTGALEAGIPGFSILGPVILLVSAMLTAAYLLPVSIRAFFPGEGYKPPSAKGKISLFLLIPAAVLTALTLLLGCFPGWLADYLREILVNLV